MCDCNKQQAPERKPHVHADVIKEWADGVAIQYYNTVRGGWEDIEKSIPSFNISTKYRVKPKPQTDLEKYGVEVGDVWAADHINGVKMVIKSPNLREDGWYYTIGGGIVGIGHRDYLLFRRGVVNEL